MSFASDHVRNVDANLEQLLLSRLAAKPENEDASPTLYSINPRESRRENILNVLIRSLSTGTARRKSSPRPDQLLHILQELTDSSGALSLDGVEYDSAHSYETELQWFLLARITNHVYGLTLQALISETLPLNNDLWYWTDVLASPSLTGLYSAQMSPIRLWNWSRSVYDEVSRKGVTLSDGWHQFYVHVRGIVRERSLSDVRQRIVAPWAVISEDIRTKLTSLRRAKLANASAIGYLLSNGFGDEDLRVDKMIGAEGYDDAYDDRWKVTVTKSVFAMDSLLSLVQSDVDMGKEDFEETLTAMTVEDPLATADPLSNGVDVHHVALRLQEILSNGLPRFTRESKTTLAKNSKPSRVLRYWIPAVALLISGSTILRIAVNRQAEILQWIRELGATTIDFWRNWVVEPLRKVIGTIRHDESSEVSIMSKQSLEGDRASLERMVIDFAVDNREGPALSDMDIADLRAKVHEGDLTPVLRAYERDLKSPLYGSVRGNLIRTLLIQVQKTKVDVEIAIGGIDSLLKSQELVFGFIGLTPGVLVCVGLFRWLGSFSSTRRDFQRGQKQSQSYQILRNIDRILTGSPQSNEGSLSFKDYGLLVCEAIVLRDLALKTFPKDAFREFVQDFNSLIDNNSGVGRQIRVADRIRWAYAKWL